MGFIVLHTIIMLISYRHAYYDKKNWNGSYITGNYMDYGTCTIGENNNNSTLFSERSLEMSIRDSTTSVSCEKVL